MENLGGTLIYVPSPEEIHGSVDLLEVSPCRL